ncbi:hypothetical protein D3C72_2077150 [compost metagenome]
MFKLAFVALLAPFRVVAVLPPPACVEPRGLQMAVGQGADPHIGIGGRNGQAVDACDFVRVFDPLAVGLAVAKLLLATAHARQTGQRGADIHQPAR